MRCSPSSLNTIALIEGNRSCTFTSSATTFSFSSPTRVFSPDSTQLGLKQLSRFPRKILEKKAEMVRLMGMVDTEEREEGMYNVHDGRTGDEVIAQFRLSYLWLIHSMKDRVEVENVAPGQETLG